MSNVQSRSTVRTSVRIDEELLHEAKTILNSLGMNYTEAVNVFTSMVVQHKGLPFDVKIPNKATAKVIKEVREGKNVEAFSLDEIK